MLTGPNNDFLMQILKNTKRKSCKQECPMTLIPHCLGTFCVSTVAKHFPIPCCISFSLM